MHFGALLEQWNWLFAIGRIVINECNFFTLKLIGAAFFLGKMLNQHIGCGPVSTQQRKVPAKGHAVSRISAPITRGNQRNLIGDHLIGQRKGNAGG